MKKDTMNKRGDIPIVILVVGVFLVCILAITSFFVSNNSVKNSFPVINTVEAASLLKEKISFYENLGYNEEQIKTLLNLQEDSQGNLVFSRDDVKVIFPWP